ncbi:MAG TPA: helix-turn-helix transcriptional regulator [Fimbriimonadaceae bacterium]|nr:helix-turn-helix transcriptional regulator [Fimbriimonadaceae bacterium]
MLSPRETQLIILAGEGLTDKEIARELDISPGTVVTLWSKLRAKLGISSRISAVAVMSAVISRLSSGFVPFEHESISIESLLGQLCGIRLLVNSKGIILSASSGAISALGIKPGQSLPLQVKAGLEIQTSEGQPISSVDVPWTQALRDASDVLDQEIAIVRGTSRTAYGLDCHVVDDPILNLVVVLDFKSHAVGRQVRGDEFAIAADQPLQLALGR